MIFVSAVLYGLNYNSGSAHLSRHTTDYTDYHFRNRGITAQNHHTHTHVPAAKTLWHSTKDTKKAPSACLLAFMTHMVLVLGGSRRPLQVLQGISHDTRNYTRRSCREGDRAGQNGSLHVPGRGFVGRMTDSIYSRPYLYRVRFKQPPPLPHRKSTIWKHTGTQAQSCTAAAWYLLISGCDQAPRHGRKRFCDRYFLGWRSASIRLGVQCKDERSAGLRDLFSTDFNFLFGNILEFMYELTNYCG